MCSLRPGVPGLSETIKVRSVLGRYLEHSRVFRFDNQGDAIVYIGSADMMHRNLDRRVETLVRLRQADHLAEMKNLFALGMSETSNSWHLYPEGNWINNGGNQVTSEHIDVQDQIMKNVLAKKSGSF
jgi:polyphosphate kinase